jgi:hypothetical protein
MAGSATDESHLTRLCEYTRGLYRLHREGAPDEAIDREFNAVCRAVWGYTLDDFDDDCLAAAVNAWLDNLTCARACRFAVRNGYDLADYVHGGCVTDWWGFVWMILAEKRGLLTPETRAATWAKQDATLLAQANVAGVIRWR